jgi:hypothetical protein
MDVLLKIFWGSSVPYTVSELIATCEDVNLFRGFMNLFMISSRRVWFIKWNRHVCDKVNSCSVYLKATCGVLQSAEEVVFVVITTSSADITTTVAIITIVTIITTAITATAAIITIAIVLQIGRSLVRFQMVSMDFFIDIKSFQSHYGPVVDSASNRNEYQEHFLGVKAADA